MVAHSARRRSLLIFLLLRKPVRTMSKKFHRLLPKRFSDSEKVVIFEDSVEANSWIQAREIFFFIYIFLIMLPNYVSVESFTG